MSESTPGWPVRRPSGTAIPKREFIGPIEPRVPIPRAQGVRRTDVQDKLKQLEVGDSFVSSMYPELIRYHAKYVGIKVTIRKLTDGSRIWRVA